MSDRAAVSGAVLAGGTSRRMGADKRWVHVAGVPMLARALDALRAAADEVFVVGGAGEGHAPVRVVADLRPGLGPLAGMETALAAAQHPCVLVVATDHPWLSPAVLRLLVDRLIDAPDHLGTVLGTASGPQPLVSAWRRTAVASVADLLDRGERRAMALTEYLPVVILPESEWRRLDPKGMTATDVDTPDDLRFGGG